ncbi:hypothetical protein [Jeotgalibaca arthritidis]|uniref:Uncharacterized protein n=1 Tax=Jeotgalibaca arthritidis TaxID=1868794 RepID=A0A6G7KBG9_9LACT|nr:hypothetical protein [Jeotgalibaca arthritidis]QII82613.1 hypothetical protein G7057_09335 [Jeotgalibaca arthritidis]
MNLLQEAYLGGLVVGVIATLVSQSSWNLIKDIVTEFRIIKKSLRNASFLGQGKYFFVEIFLL